MISLVKSQVKAAPLDEQHCWNAVQRRDAAFDGRFFFGVLTTGVYCRPSCASRRALRKNVRFYPPTAAAERDGLRPCKRCKPDQPPKAGDAAKR